MLVESSMLIGGRVDSVLNDIHFIAVFNQALPSGSDGVILFHEATVPSVYFDDGGQKDGRALTVV